MFKQHYRPDLKRDRSAHKELPTFSPRDAEAGKDHVVQHLKYEEVKHHRKGDIHTKNVEHKSSAKPEIPRPRTPDTALSECAVLVNYMHAYANLEANEQQALANLHKQENFNLFNAFDVLNPNLGIVTSKSLLRALKHNLGIEISDQSIVDDLIQRLAYTSENSLLISDMKYFEPEKNTVFYNLYKINISKKQVC